MKTLREYIADAESSKTAIGHFNISNIEGFWAVVRSARALNVPVIIGVSEGERDFIGVRQVKALVDTIRDEGFPVFLNADHTYSFDRVKEVVDAGFDAVIVDAAKLSLDENISLTKQCVSYVREHNPGMLIEGELGYIGQSSKVLDEIPEGINLDPSALTNASDAKRYVSETGIDLLAPAVGNIHGIIKTGNPALHIDRVQQIRSECGVPLVLHGGSGNSKEDFKNAIHAGISIVHINTEIRVAYVNGLKKALIENPDEVAPYKILKTSIVNMEEIITEKLKLFSGKE